MRRRWLLIALLLATVRPDPARAHTFSFTGVTFELEPDGTYAVDITCDLDALALGVPSTADSAALAAEIEGLEPARREELVEGLRSLLGRRLRVRFDGEPDDFEVSLPGRGRPPVEGAPPAALGTIARLTGRVPEGAREATFFASRAFPPVRLTVRRPGADPAVEVLDRGGESRPISLSGPALGPGPLETMWRFFVLGVTHIVPSGLDHILFVTVAHTLTLALSSYGVVRLSPRVVEPLIALSIAWVAIENVVSPRLRASRLVLVFAFGLLHGLGFAGVLGDIGLPEVARLRALLSFNVGVEAGQLAVVAAAVVALAAWTRLGGDRRTAARSTSLVIAAVGAFWTVQRLLAP